MRRLPRRDLRPLGGLGDARDDPRREDRAGPGAVRRRDPAGRRRHRDDDDPGRRADHARGLRQGRRRDVPGHQGGRRALPRGLRRGRSAGRRGWHRGPRRARAAGDLRVLDPVVALQGLLGDGQGAAGDGDPRPVVARVPAVPQHAAARDHAVRRPRSAGAGVPGQAVGSRDAAIADLGGALARRGWSARWATRSRCSAVRRRPATRCTTSCRPPRSPTSSTSTAHT
jgi:hypothetical protein